LIEARERHVWEVRLNEKAMNKRLLHQNILVDDASMPNPIDNIFGSKPNVRPMELKNDAMNSRNAEGSDRCGNNRNILNRLPIIPKLNTGNPK
jgi:hypothetical protein